MGGGVSTAEVNRISDRKADAAAARVKNQMENNLSSYKKQVAYQNEQQEKRFQRQMERQQQMMQQRVEMENQLQEKRFEQQLESQKKMNELQEEKFKKHLAAQKLMLEQQLEAERLQREADRLELERLAALETEEETKQKCQTIVDKSFENEFGATIPDIKKAPEWYKNLENDQKNLMSSILDGKVKDQELIQRVQDAFNLEPQNCETVIDWYLDPNPKNRVEKDDDALERNAIVTDITVLGFQELQDLDQIMVAVETMFANLRPQMRKLLTDVALTCVDTIKMARSLESVERSKCEEYIEKVEGDGRTITLRIRNALCFKYLKRNVVQDEDIDSTPQIMGDDGKEMEDEDQIVQERFDDVRVVVAYRTTVHTMKTVEGGMNQKENQAAKALGWF